MLQFGNKEFRNLEEQVEKNAQDIQDFKDGNQTIAEFGITVVGILATAAELPAQGENYGDAYLIGTSTPYDMRVWTRDVANSTAKWVDLGAFPLQGPKGDKGDIGSIITVGSGEPLNNPTSAYNFYINTVTGYWYSSVPTDTGYAWHLGFTLKGEKGDRGEQGKQGVQGLTGPQGKTGPIGPQGQKGDKGDVGPAFNVQGTLASSSNLPTPTAAMQDKGYAYIIPDAQGTKHIWVIQGSESTSFSWVDVGAAGVGIQGPKGTDGVGLNTLTDTDLTYGDLSTTYDTVDGLTVYSTMRQTYDGTNHDSEVKYTVPIIGSDTISIDLDSGNNKLVVKVDPTANIVGATFEARDNPTSPVEYTILRYSGILEYHNPVIDAQYYLPQNVSGNHTLLSDNNVKTLFGNKSIVGEGNIDLYRHVITATDSSNRGLIMLVFSSKNLNVKSLTDLKTLLGNTFNYPASGWSSDYNNPDNPSGIITRVTETTIYGINPITHLERTLGTWAGFTITDDVKAV